MYVHLLSKISELFADLFMYKFFLVLFVYLHFFIKIYWVKFLQMPIHVILL